MNEQRLQNLRQIAAAVAEGYGVVTELHLETQAKAAGTARQELHLVVVKHSAHGPLRDELVLRADDSDLESLVKETTLAAARQLAPRG